MTYALLIPIVTSLLIYFLPVYLQRRAEYSKSSQYFVSTGGADKILFQNSSVAYALQMATLGPFFVWGATGNFLPAVLNTGFFCLGLFLIYWLRSPMLSFLKSSLSSSESVTIHQFIARAHGNDHRVKLIASVMTIFALFGLVLAELFGLLTVVQPFFGPQKDVTYTFTIGVFFLMFLYSTVGGNDGVMHSDQLQLGLAYVGIFVSAFSLMLGFVSNNIATPSNAGMGGLVLLMFCALALLLLRKFRFLVPSRGEKTSGNKLKGVVCATLYRFEQVLNWIIVISMVIMFVIGTVNVIKFGWNKIGVLSLFTWQMSSPMMVALCILPLFYQIIDITNWQRIAALEVDQKEASEFESSSKAIKGYALEAPTTWLALLAFGGLATFILPGTIQDDVVGQFIKAAMGSSSIYFKLTLIGFMVAAFAIALSTMDAVFSAALCAFRYDILPIVKPSIAQIEAQAIRWSSAFGMAGYFVIIFGLFIAERYLSFGRGAYLAILLAFYSGQLAFVPLILGPLFLKLTRRNDRAVGGLWASLILVAGFIVGLSAVLIGIFLPKDRMLLGVSPDDWMWISVSASLLLSCILYLIGVICHEKTVASKVRKVLYADKSLSMISTGVRVKAYKGRVVLEGFVAEQGYIQVLVTKVKEIAGDEHVENKIEVRPN